MPGSLITLPARLTVRATRAVLITTRDAAQQALGIVDLVAQVVETPRASDMPPPPRPRRFTEPPPEAEPSPFPTGIDISEDPEFGTPHHLSEEPELVEEVADTGVQNGAGATIRVDAPWPGYERLRSADVVARLRGADAAELAAIELFESTHRKRRTVLDGIAREIKRRPPA